MPQEFAAHGLDYDPGYGGGLHRTSLVLKVSHHVVRHVLGVLFGACHVNVH